MRTLIILGLITTLVFGMFTTQKAEAFDPVTIAILAPIAIEAAEIAYPYVVRGLTTGGAALIDVGVDILSILYLPLGVLEVALLWPFGLFSSGCSHIVKGFCAPFTLVWDVLMLPLNFCGIST